MYGVNNLCVLDICLPHANLRVDSLTFSMLKQDLIKVFDLLYHLIIDGIYVWASIFLLLIKHSLLVISP